MSIRARPLFTKRESILSKPSPPPKLKQEPVIAPSSTPQPVKEETLLLQPSTPRSVKKEDISLPQPSQVKKETVLPELSKSQNKRNKPSPPQAPKKEQLLSHFSNTQQSINEQQLLRSSHPPHVKKEFLLCSTSQPQNVTRNRHGKRKRKSTAPNQTTNTTTKQEQTEQTVSPSHDNSSKPSFVLTTPQKRQRLQPPQSQQPFKPSLPAKTENPVYDEVVIVSERIVKEPSQHASKNTQPQAVPIGPQNCAQVVNESSTPAQVLTPQTEHEKELLIQDYALYVVERDPETKAITWVACKFCPIYGCQHRQRSYIKAYHVPLRRNELEQHVAREHQKIWKLFKNASKEEKQAIFYRKRMPLNHVLQRRIAELKLGWGMKDKFTDVQKAAWREQNKIAQRWKKSSHARKKVTVKALADNLGIDLSALPDDRNKTVGHKKSRARGKESANDRMSKEETPELGRERRRELRQEADILEAEMKDFGSKYEMMSGTALKAAMERRKRYERRIAERNGAT